MRIVFMGTPEFAVPSLQKLIVSRHSVVGVVTQPDRPKGRGQMVSIPPVKRETQKYHIPITQPENLSDPIFGEQLVQWNADCFIVVGFRILPETIYKIPPKGSINLHASLLPRYRGAAPIQWAIINGEKETGVTTFCIRKKVDTGDMILQEKVQIGEKETAGELHDRLAAIGADLLLKTVDLIESDRAERIPQCGLPVVAPKILPGHCKIQWNKSADEIDNLIRGLSPRPGAFTTLNGSRLKIFHAKRVEPNSDFKAAPGEIVRCGKDGLWVQTGKGCLLLWDVQLEGKKRMGIAEFLCGRAVTPGVRLGESGGR